MVSNGFFGNVDNSDILNYQNNEINYFIHLSKRERLLVVHTQLRR